VTPAKRIHALEARVAELESWRVDDLERLDELEETVDRLRAFVQSAWAGARPLVDDLR
jgi:hypothetical protein